uniref:Uncharacterized protein n=1 Tax=Romanomermis culicivorax TaxID=13658 RepID=A0A915JVZ8_ROMCU
MGVVFLVDKISFEGAVELGVAKMGVTIRDDFSTIRGDFSTILDDFSPPTSWNLDVLYDDDLCRCRPCRYDDDATTNDYYDATNDDDFSPPLFPVRRDVLVVYACCLPVKCSSRRCWASFMTKKQPQMSQTSMLRSSLDGDSKF